MDLGFYDETLQEYLRRSSDDIVDNIQVLENIYLGNRVRKMCPKLDRLPIKLGHKKVSKLGDRIACRRLIGYPALKIKVFIGVIINSESLDLDMNVNNIIQGDWKDFVWSQGCAI